MTPRDIDHVVDSVRVDMGNRARIATARTDLEPAIDLDDAGVEHVDCAEAAAAGVYSADALSPQVTPEIWIVPARSS